MNSPKFNKKATELRRIVSASILEKLWSKKRGVRDHLRKQILPDAVEYLDFHMQRKQRCNALESLVCNGEYIPSPVLRMKVEKGNGLCRQVALPSPDDALVLQALSDSLWREIKLKAPFETSFFAPQDQPFTKLNPTEDEIDTGYGPIESWLDFQREVLRFSEIKNYVVVTDIANYYDGIIHSFLRAILSDYGVERESALDLLLFILENMLWRPDYMPNPGIGLPQMGLDAPRLLAHTHLFEIDEIFSGDPDVEFARYMDDMDFGVDTLAKAKEVLRDLDLALHTRNIRLNSGKTKIMTAREAVKHFRVKENSYITRLEEKISSHGYDKDKLLILQNTVSRLIRSGIERGEFDTGNGGKILKRLLGILYRNGSPLDDNSFRDIIYNRPALRDYALRAWARSSHTERQLPIVIGYLGSGQAIDEYSYVLIAQHFVSSLFTLAVPYSDLHQVLYHLRGDNPFVLYSKLLVVSRFDTVSRLLSEIEKSKRVWSRHAFLSRLVASFYGLFRLDPGFANFRELVLRMGGAEARSVFEFHEGISTDAKSFLEARRFISAGNPSTIIGASHAKILMLASSLTNGSVPKLDRARLLATHSKAMTDRYYRQTLSHVISVAP